MTDLRAGSARTVGRVGPPPLPADIGDVAVPPAYLPDAPYRVPADRYTSAEFARLEQERLWPSVWQVACSVDHVASPGDAVDCRLGPLSALVIRDGDGRLRAFQNVCRHRGNTLCEGNRRGLSELRCPYHRWTWDLQGRLREVPSRRGFGALDMAELGLVPVAVDTWGPLVFVNFDAGAAPLREWLEGVPDDAAWAELEQFRCVATATTRVPCNWKVVVDGFSETYHVQGIHQEMLGSIDDVHAPQRIWGRHSVSYQPYGVPSPRLGPDVRPEEVWASFRRVFGDRVGGAGVPAEAEAAPAVPDGMTMQDVIADRIRAAQAGAGVDLSRYTTEAILRLAQYNLFPNATLLVWADMVNLLVGRPGPTADTAELTSYVFTRMPDPTGPRRPPLDLERSADADFGVVLNADVSVLLTMQRGLSQPGFRELVLSAEECRIVNFHRQLEQQLGL
ncbi:MAG TPA: aromatic ring-hydroxylating dioxygenase subunit alpha [Acidimicrobiales bacterium]|nr:aromatic ring-hydroxylating dioxygenase subunit alpha [Acidimicrobiales bacterium]